MNILVVQVLPQITVYESFRVPVCLWLLVFLKLDLNKKRKIAEEPLFRAGIPVRSGSSANNRI